MARKVESFSMKPCSTASMEAEEGALMRCAGKEKSSLKPCNQKGGSKSMEEFFSLKPCSTGCMAAAEGFTATSESMSVEAVGEDFSLRVCPTKRKALTAGEDDSSDEDTAADVSKVKTAEKGALGKLSDDSEDGPDDDDDDESITESEFAAFLEEERAEYKRFWEEEVLPRNPDWVFKDYTLVTTEGDVCDYNDKVEAAPESN